MSAWTVVPCLLALREEFNAISPARDRGADGTIGNSLHTSSSDHTPDEDSAILRDHDADSKNEVHALDIDSTGPWPPGRSFRQIVLDVVARERAKWLDASDMCRLNYVILDRKIYDKDDDFEPRDYFGTDPHTNHAHFSARYETRAETDTRPWGVKENDVTEAELIAAVNKALENARGQAAIGDAAWNHQEENPDSTATPKATARMGGWARMAEQRERTRFTDVRSDVAELSRVVAELAKDAGIDTDALMAQLSTISTQIEGVDEATAERLKGKTPAETASLLRAVLGADAPEVGRLLQTSSTV